MNTRFMDEWLVVSPDQEEGVEKNCIINEKPMMCACACEKKRG